MFFLGAKEWNQAATVCFCFFAAAAAKTSGALNVPSIACTGHLAVQMPQPMHLAWSMAWIFFNSPDGASTGQTFEQI
jgi:hypothetical protein